MSRRRRLALRQVAEPEIAAELSDVEDAQDHDVVTADPNFNLLGMIHIDGAAARDSSLTTSLPSVLLPSSTQPVINTGMDGEAFMGQSPTQVVASISENGNGVVQSAKKARVDTTRSVIPPREAGAPKASNNHARGVFQLYQTGLCDDHTLRLHFIRRRPPPPPDMPVESEFVLPRPRLSLLDMLPPRMTSLSDILRIDDAVEATIQSESANIRVPMDDIVQSVTAHWPQLNTVDLKELGPTWRRLQECDWMRVCEASGSSVPAIEDLIRLLETLQSDAFASFVWRELLVPIVQTLCRDKASPSTVTQFTTALLTHKFFYRLPAKDFRAQLRAKSLRACGDSTFGAAVEMEIITRFHQSRIADV